MHYNIKMHYTS